MTNAANGSQPIRDPRQLRQAIAAGRLEFQLLLAGGACFSRKRITMNGRGHFGVFNYVDDTVQSLTAKELYTKSNIGEAMRKGAFVVGGQNHD